MAAVARKKTDPRVIGAAVLGTVALIIAAVMIFGSGKVIDDRPRAVILFDGSVNGLSVGAPVTLRGVQVGEVVDIRLRADVREHRVSIPVYVAFNLNNAQVLGVRGEAFAISTAAAVERGLRAQLQMQSVITGQLYVELGFMPHVAPRMLSTDRGVPEIPAAPRILDVLQDQLSGMPLRQIGDGALRVMDLLDGLLNTPEIANVLTEGAGATSELHGVLTEVHGQVAPVAGNVIHATTEADRAMAELQATAHALQTETRATLGQIRETLKTFETQGTAIGSDVKATLRAVDRTVLQVDTAAAGIAGTVGDGTPGKADIDQILRNLAAATRALRGLSETLERNPNALVTGKR